VAKILVFRQAGKAPCMLLPETRRSRLIAKCYRRSTNRQTYRWLKRDGVLEKRLASQSAAGHFQVALEGSLDCRSLPFRLKSAGSTT
jgi:hypothetical protein